MRKIIKASMLMILAVTALFLSGPLTAGMAEVGACDFGKIGSAAPARVTHVPNRMIPIALNSVRVIDKNISRKIMPHAVFARTTRTGTLEVIVRLRNCTNFMQEVLVRTSFMDANQQPAEPISVWQRVFLAPGSMQTYNEKSMKPGVGYYLIEVDQGG
ncbi:MAG: hypothetical protein AB3N28_09550 [Kordiimonas sp.]